ncbi:leucine-rich repeat-containing protein 20-like [Centruroides sculpturatus]|uniref:leucine-rich repeat-containing protein 20-like n=1 Tax=Centruroides sculpturatus TaxID=218467 RepID=UPI000C6E8658|nr:leucine-rich repeat-containing protein 20-like [Centruroides sculpturatus]
MAGKAVIKVVHRCTDATVNQNLDLSECQLMSFPDAIYHLMRNTVLLGCDLSSNVLRKLPSKFAIKFVYITELNLANNRLSTLPDELLDVTELQRLDISRNDFLSLPKVVFKLPRLTHLNAQKNYISEVDVNRLKSAPALQEVDLRNNPLDRSNLGQLMEFKSPRLTVQVSPLAEEDEDLKDLLEFEDDPLPSDRNRD